MITGSVAIITEAVHSAVDLVASIVAYFSVRKAEEPADRSHPYGHEKVENLAAALEGVLIVLGAAIIIYEAIKQALGRGRTVERLGIGIAVIGISAAVNFAISGYLYRQAKLTDSPALEGDAAHLRTDAVTSLGVLVALALVQITGVQEIDADRRARGGRRDRLRGRAAGEPLLARARRRGAARGRARPHRERDPAATARPR